MPVCENLSIVIVTAGLWTPHLAQPKEKIAKWSLQTRQRLLNLAQQGWPCTMGPVTVLHTQTPIENVKDIDLLKSVIDVEVKIQGQRIEMKYIAPIIQPLKFMERLSSELQQEGCNFVKRKITTIPEFLKTYSPKPNVVVSCLGLGSLQVLEDQQCFPIRGVLVRCKPCTDVFPVQAFMHADHPRGITYVVSRPDLCILGGSGEVGNSNTQTTKEETELVVSRVAETIPALSSDEDIRNKVVNTWAGLRPGRQFVRVQIDNSFDVPVVHNYGHGGSGWTVSWGCALESTNYVEQVLQRHSKL